MNMAIAEDWSSLTPNKHNRYTRLIFPGTSEHDRYTGLIFPGTQLTQLLQRTDPPQHSMNKIVTEDWAQNLQADILNTRRQIKVNIPTYQAYIKPEHVLS